MRLHVLLMITTLLSLSQYAGAQEAGDEQFVEFALVDQVPVGDRSPSAGRPLLENGSLAAPNKDTSGTPPRVRSSNCIFELETLTPAISNIVRLACPQSLSLSQAEYCSCVRRFTDENENITAAKLENTRSTMKRIGYQYLLERWADAFGGHVLAVASLQGRAVASEARMPPSCNAASIFTELETKINSSSCSSNREDKNAFRAALGAVFRLNTAVPSRVFNDIRARGVNVGSSSALLASIEQADRFYPQPGGQRPHRRTFVDCMSAGNKRAYALLPVRLPRGSFVRDDETQDEGVFRREKALNRALELLNTIKSNGIMTEDLYSPELRSVLMIFPGADSILKSGDINKTKWMAETLHGFVNRLKTEPAYRQIGEARASKNAMEMMKQDVDRVQLALRAKLTEMNGGEGDGPLIAQSDKSCGDMKDDLLTLACSPSNFIGSTTFMVSAYADASNRGNRRYGQTEPPPYAKCFDGNDSSADPYDCLTYGRLQCDAISQRLQSSATVPGNLQSLVNINLEDERSLKDIRSDALADRNTLADEEGVVHLLCEGFNNQLRTRTCLSEYNNMGTDRGESYRSCAAQDGRFEAYLNSPEGQLDPRAQGVAAGAFSGAQLAPSPTRIERTDTFDGGMLAATDAPVVNTIGTTNLSGAIRSAAGQFGPVATTITGGPTTPLDIDSPAELRREMEQRDRIIETKTAEIAAVNEQLEDATSDTEIARLRRDLAALQADMAAAQTERNAFAARLAEREAASARAVASADDEDEENTPAPSRRVDSRGNLVGGGGGISRGPASEGFVTGGGARNTGAGNAGFSPEFTNRTVDSTFGSAGARGGERPIVRDAQALPAVSGAGSQLALRVGTASYAVKDVATVVIPRGTQASEQEITRLILAAKAENKIVLDDQQRAMVEVWDEASQSSRMVYVQFNGEVVAFIPLDQSSEQTAPMRATLAQLEGLLDAGRGAASETKD